MADTTTMSQVAEATMAPPAAVAYPVAEPYYPLTDDNHAALAVIASLIFAIYAVTGIVLKLIIRFNITSLKLHDYVLLVGTAVLIIQTALVIVACNRGLGMHQDAVPVWELEVVHKLSYACSLLALIVAATTKASLCLFIESINSNGRLKFAERSLFGAIAIWAVSSLLAEAFQCSLPNPWRADSRDRCPAQEGIYVYVGVGNIVTDLALVLLPICMLWKVQMTTRKKCAIISLFATRIIVPVVSIPNLVATRKYMADPTDATWKAISHVIWTQISLGLSVLTACIPSLKGVIDSLMAGTAGATLQTPYELNLTGKANDGFEAYAVGGGGSNSNPSQQLSGGSGGSRTGGEAGRGKKNLIKVITSFKMDAAVTGSGSGGRQSPRPGGVSHRESTRGGEHGGGGGGGLGEYDGKSSESVRKLTERENNPPGMFNFGEEFRSRSSSSDDIGPAYP